MHTDGMHKGMERVLVEEDLPGQEEKMEERHEDSKKKEMREKSYSQECEEGEIKSRKRKRMRRMRY